MLLGDVCLSIAEDGRGELDVPRLVDAVDVAEGCSNREVRADFHESLVGVRHFGRLGVEVFGVGIGVVDAVFFAPGDAQFDFERHAEGRHALQVVDADIEVLFHRLFGEVEHVRTEQRRTGRSKVLFTDIEETRDPGQLALRAVIGVENDASAVGLSHGLHMPGTSDRTQDRRLGTVDRDVLAPNEGRAACGKLDDDWTIHLAGRFHHSVH